MMKKPKMKKRPRARKMRRRKTCPKVKKILTKRARVREKAMTTVISNDNFLILSF